MSSDTDHFILHTGAKMPKLGFGTFRYEGDDATRAVETAIENGCRHFDTAQGYHNEYEVGDGIAHALDSSGLKREDIFVTSKLWVGNLTHDAVIRTTKESLENLGTQHIDLMLIHWPDPTVPLDETMGALKQLVDEGKIKHVGLSNFPVAEMEKAVEAAKKHGLTIACNQVEYHPFLDQQKLLAAARKHHIPVIAHSPMAQGLEGRLAGNAEIARIALKHKVTPQEIALAWLTKQDGVGAIFQSAVPEHIRKNLTVSSISLDAGDIEVLNGINLKSNSRCWVLKQWIEGSPEIAAQVGKDFPHPPTWDVPEGLEKTAAAATEAAAKGGIKFKTVALVSGAVLAAGTAIWVPTAKHKKHDNPDSAALER